MLSARFGQALQYATLIHAGQTRKGGGIPYVSHLLGVASIAMEHGADEDEAIAALLHDAGEDAGGEPRINDIREHFGQRVAEIVLCCSDTLQSHKPAWRERKEQYISHLRKATASARLVSAADRLHNARAILRDYRIHGENVWSRFNGDRDGTLWYYRALVDVFHATTDGRDREMSELVRELERVVSELVLDASRAVEDKADVLVEVCRTLSREARVEAAAVLKVRYPFVPARVTSRRYAPRRFTRVFVRDGFVDRYSGQRLVFPPVLRLISAILPDVFPYHRNWKAEVTHPAYYELSATLDHGVPVCHGGPDEESNWFTTSMARNNAKGNWSLAELGWTFHPPGCSDQWDGLLRWFVDYTNVHPQFLSDKYLRQWRNAADAVLRRRSDGTRESSALLKQEHRETPCSNPLPFQG